MWRLTVVTFGILALAFYEMSGGADYAPAENSVQRKGIGPHYASKTSDGIERASLAQVQNSESELGSGKSVQSTLANLPVARVETAETQSEKALVLTAQPNASGLPEDAAEADIIAALQEAGAEMREASNGAIQLFARAERDADTQRILKEEEDGLASSEARDIRVVQGDVVNMRGGPGTEYDKIAAITGGTEVVVLFAPGNGWLELQIVETGQVGWMADWLVSTAYESSGFSGAAAGATTSN